jgi:hypothetical protein
MVTQGFLKEVIEQKKVEFSVSCNIPVETVRSRIKQRSLAPTHPGTSPPLHDAELAMVKICIQMGKIHQPLTCEEAIAIMNYIISETERSESENLTQFEKAGTSNSGTFGGVVKIGCGALRIGTPIRLFRRGGRSWTKAAACVS